MRRRAAAAAPASGPRRAPRPDARQQRERDAAKAYVSVTRHDMRCVDQRHLMAEGQSSKVGDCNASARQLLQLLDLKG
jgi:hypothetical protein